MRAVAKEYRISPENIYCVGDEVDQYHGSQFPKSVDARHTAEQELRVTRDKLKAWFAAFPYMKLAVSNHGLRWVKKAVAAEIPSQMIRAYQELMGAPAGWQWKEEWIIRAKHPFRLIHGMGYSGKDGARNAAIDSGISTVIGHLHGFGGAWHICSNNGRRLWALNTGCLIDPTAYAFQYGKYSRNKETLGLGLVLDDGLTPIFIPREVFR